MIASIDTVFPDMDNNSMEKQAARMKDYLAKVATGPEHSRDLKEDEAEDALTLILRGAVSPVRAGVFLVAMRMKRETIEENLGFWKALDRTTIKHSVNLDRLLQVADPFDGFDRVPYFGFYAIPVIAAMGLPVYGHSTLPLPPKFGITFEEILHRHYGASLDLCLDTRKQLLEEFQFGYISLRQSHPLLEGLRELRVEMVKRTVLSTFEKMLMPFKAQTGGNYLATGYFHKGYEIPMLAAAKASEFDRVLIGGGMEGTTLYGVHKKARIFTCNRNETQETTLTFQEAGAAYAELKKETATLDSLAEWGEAALKNNQGPAATLIACQSAALCNLSGVYPSFNEAFDVATEILRRGTAYDRFLRFIDQCRK